ncbi:hypothetical protein [Shimia sp.]|uniref:hypothetical protein n=1 Tax=Shimia sp. TaxID=1954381 RepID=UPI003BAADAAD
MDSLLKDPAKNVIVRGGYQIIFEEDERYFIAVGATQSERQVFFNQKNITPMEAVTMLGGLNDDRKTRKGCLFCGSMI